MAEEEKLDVVIFGASGYTGKYVIREFLKFLPRPDGTVRRIGLAGRSRTKLSAALAWASPPHARHSLPLIEADVSDPPSINAMVARTRLVLNCVGPYRLYGEVVVTACVRAGVDCLDITGEPEFMERMEEKYHEEALLNSCVLVSACGFDSIPAEFGLIHQLKQWDVPSVPNRVGAYVHLHSTLPIVGNFATWESAVLGVSSANDLRKMRQRRKPQVRVRVPGAPSKKPSLLSRPESISLWSMPLPSADTSVVRRTQSAFANEARRRQEENPNTLSATLFKPVHFAMYFCLDNLFSTLSSLWTGLAIIVLARFGWGRSLLLDYPGFFSCGRFRRGGPTEEQVAAAGFHMWFLGQGYSNEAEASTAKQPDVSIVTRVAGPEIGYITTPICLVQCALILLDDRTKVPSGGVYTPAFAFANTDLESRLSANGLSFECISKSF